MAVFTRVSTRRRAASAVATAVVAAVAGTAAVAGPAQSAADPACPAAFPIGDLASGDPVHGLTVSKGTTPEAFTGEVIGRISNGIAPGMDMIMMRLTSSEIDRAGIWAGMSGSPVYAADGRLIGAVSYGLAWGPSPVAGVTPAEDMLDLLDAPPAAAAKPAEHVKAPRAAVRALVGADAASKAEADAGFDRLPMPLGVSGFTSTARLNKAAKKFGFAGMKPYRAGATSADAEATEIVPGGNLAASVSYGDVTAAGVGTATAVCGQETLAFGHPMLFSGASTMTMHGADALYVQDDLLVSFKVANPTAPVGGITDDRTAGLRGLLGDAPEAASITANVAARGDSRTGNTMISVGDWVPYLAATHLLVDSDRVFDGIGKGSSAVSWTVKGHRANGTPFQYTRADHFTSRFDITFEPTWRLYDQLAQLVYNDFEDVTIDSVNANAAINEKVRMWTVSKVEAKVGSNWVVVNRSHPLVKQRGSTANLRVTLKSYRNLEGTKLVRLDVRVPNARSVDAWLSVFGGLEAEGDESAGKSFEEVLRAVAKAPRNDQVFAELLSFRPGGKLDRAKDVGAANAAVAGSRFVPVRIR